MPGKEIGHEKDRFIFGSNVSLLPHHSGDEGIELRSCFAAYRNAVSNVTVGCKAAASASALEKTIDAAEALQGNDEPEKKESVDEIKNHADPAAVEKKFEFLDEQYNYEKLVRENGDFVAVLSIPALGITYPVVQGKNNSEYLSKLFDGTQSSSGSIFLEAGASLDDWNKFMYGHNMKNGSMFGSLKRLLTMDEDVVSNGIEVYISTSASVTRYRVFAADVLDVNSDLLQTGWTKKNYQQYVSEVMANNLLKNTEAAVGGNLLSLYTCYGTDHQHKLVVYAEAEMTANYM